MHRLPVLVFGLVLAGSCTPLCKADIVIRDTIGSAVAVLPALNVLTTNELSSTPSIEINSESIDRTITEVTLLMSRSSITPNYDNFAFVFAQVLNVNDYRSPEFGHAVANGLPYAPVNQATMLLQPHEINPTQVQGFGAEELVFRNLSISIEANAAFDLLAVAVPIGAPNGESVFLTLSTGNEFLDRYDRGTVPGGLVPNLDFGFAESQYAVRVVGVASVPEPSIAFVLVVSVGALARFRRPRI